MQKTCFLRESYNTFKAKKEREIGTGVQRMN